MSSTVKKVLILAANPEGTSRLRLDTEVRDIEAGLVRSKMRDRFEIISKWAVRPRDIQRAMLEISPHIIHFSGHGTGDKGLIFEDNEGHPRLVDSEALARLFELFSDKLQCVVLNGCYSETQAKSIAEFIDYVIGMQCNISDEAAIEFAVGFYDALGAGRSVDFAYQLACSAISLAGLGGNVTPVLFSRSREQASDEEAEQEPRKKDIPQSDAARFQVTIADWNDNSYELRDVAAVYFGGMVPSREYRGLKVLKGVMEMFLAWSDIKELSFSSEDRTPGGLPKSGKYAIAVEFLNSKVDEFDLAPVFHGGGGAGALYGETDYGSTSIKLKDIKRIDVNA